jgi:hypothetical protein
VPSAERFPVLYREIKVSVQFDGTTSARREMETVTWHAKLKKLLEKRLP